MNRPVHAIIFDCFGVVIHDALKALCEERYHKDPLSERKIRDIITACNAGMLDATQATAQLADAMDMSLPQYRAYIAKGEVCNIRLLEYIQSLKPGYKIAMLSNVGKGSLNRRITEHGLAQYFDLIIASGDEGVAKPDVRAYQLTAERLGVDPSACVFTDDIPSYCQGARDAGMQAIVFKNTHQFRTDLAALLPA